MPKTRGYPSLLCSQCVGCAVIFFFFFFIFHVRDTREGFDTDALCWRGEWRGQTSLQGLILHRIFPFPLPHFSMSLICCSGNEIDTGLGTCIKRLDHLLLLLPSLYLSLSKRRQLPCESLPFLSPSLPLCPRSSPPPVLSNPTEPSPRPFSLQPTARPSLHPLLAPPTRY